MFKKGLLLVSLFSLCFSFNSFATENQKVESIMDYVELPAEVRTTLTNGLLDLKDFLDNETGGEWREDANGNYSFYDSKGNMKYGYSYGQYGDIYYQKEGSDSIVVDTCINKVYFDKIGRMSNICVDTTNQYIDAFKELENNGSVFLEGKSAYDSDLFLDMYELNYCLLNQDLRYYDEYKTGGRLVSLKYDVPKTTEEVRLEILEKFEPLKGNNDYEKIVNMCEQLRVLKYDLSYTNENVDKCLRDNRAVCWHYVKIGKVLLEEAGIYSEVLPCVVVASQGGHVILRCKIDGSWIYCDPTWIEGLGYTNAIIPYSELVKKYDFLMFYKE